MGARLRGLAVGAGYFSQFHYEAWARIPEVELVAVCDPDQARAWAVQERFNVSRAYAELDEAIERESPDFIDIITPPATHRSIIESSARRVKAIICQKPLADSLEDAQAIVSACQQVGCRLMVHENFRFQPWHREIKRLLVEGTIGAKLHTLTFRSRPGDGWAADAYLARQPYFRGMKRFLIHETGIHFIDTFRFLAGEVTRVYCRLRKLNPSIAGEDCGLLVLEFQNGAIGLWDANRYNESNTTDPRYTFGEFLVEADGGSIRLALDGTMTVQPLGEAERQHAYLHERKGFGGDCVLAAQRHFVERLLDGRPFETQGAAYLENLRVEEACYESARSGLPVDLVSNRRLPTSQVSQP